MTVFSYLKVGLGDTRHGTIRLMNSSEDRRRRRSPDPLVALHYQLTQARRDAALDTLVVADGSGVVVAGAGSWAACEELAAFAPLMFEGAMSSDERVSIRSVNVGIGRVLLAYEQFVEGEHVSAFADLWQRFDVLRGNEVVLLQGDRRVAGTATGIDDEGSLLIRPASGRLQRFHAGDVSIEKTS